jgi:hypothetical protein
MSESKPTSARTPSEQSVYFRPLDRGRRRSIFCRPVAILWGSFPEDGAAATAGFEGECTPAYS